jgi:NAD(P)H-hydrate epimerase
LLDGRVREALPALDAQAHKGTRGHLLAIAGSTGKSGAALLCGHAALRAGAGLVTVCSPEPTRAALDGRVPELMTAGYHWDPPNAAEAWRAVELELAGKRALAVGPGVPTDDEFRALLERVLGAARAQRVPVVLDADGLNHLARDPSLLAGASADATVLTPHPGEAARLLARSTGDVQSDRPGAALALAKKFGVVCALKGARTMVAAPDGRLAVCPTGNPGLGTGGTGDVLTGCVGALLAQGLDAWSAATLGVYAHGDAGDRAALAFATRGITATDVIAHLPRALAGDR